MADLLLDTGPLVAFLNAADARHPRARQLFSEAPAPFRSCEAVLTEAAWLLRAAPGGHAALDAMLERGAVVLDFSLAEEHAAVFALMRRYASVPMSLADACLVRMSELRPDPMIFTFDSDFLVYRRLLRRTIPTRGLKTDAGGQT